MSIFPIFPPFRFPAAVLVLAGSLVLLPSLSPGQDDPPPQKASPEAPEAKAQPKAKEKAKPKAKARPAPLVTKTYRVPVELPSHLAVLNKSAKADPDPADPFSDLASKDAPPPEVRSIQAQLEEAGVAFGEGASAEFDPETRQLRHTNVAEQIANGEEILETLRDESEKQVFIYLEMIEVEHADFSDWLFGNILDSDGTPLRNEVQEWIREGRAEIIESATVVARSGQRARVESIDEYIYPTEYDPAEIPTEVTLEDGAEAPVTPVTPTAFETRNLGTTLEVDPIISADKPEQVDLNLAPEHVQLETVEHWHHRTIEPKFQVHMPTFYTMKITTQVRAQSGRYAFLGTNRPLRPADPDREDALVLQFVRPDVGALFDWSEVVEAAGEEN